MKVKYKGPLAEATVPRVGKFKKGEIRNLPDDVARGLIASGSFIYIPEPKPMPPKKRTKWVPKKATQVEESTDEGEEDIEDSSSPPAGEIDEETPKDDE